MALNDQGVQARANANLSLIVACMAVALPWLNPLATGPSPAVIPLLFAWACTAVFVLVSRQGDGTCQASRLAAVVATGWLAVSLLSAGLGLLQYFGISSFLAPWVSSTLVGEAYAQLRQRNQFATLTNIGLIALMWWSLQLPAQRQVRVRNSVLLGLAAALLTVGNAASSSRTGLVQLATLVGLVCLAGGWRQVALRRVLVTAITVYVVAAFTLPVLVGFSLSEAGLMARLSQGAESCQSRAVLWRNMLYLIALRPWTGWGWGELDFAHFVTPYAGPRFCDLLDNAHNLPLHLAVEIGIPAALLVCGGVAWLVFCDQPWREKNASRQMAWAVLAMIGLHSMVEYPLWYGPFQTTVVLCLVLLWPPRLAAAGTQLRAWSPVLATTVLLATAYGAWDYRRISQIYLPSEQRSASYRDHTLDKMHASWLFREQVRFAEITLTPLTPDNAEQLNTMAHELLHFSPEARVVEKLIESAVLLGRNDEAHFFMARYRTAYPEDYRRWLEAGR